MPFIVYCQVIIRDVELEQKTVSKKLSYLGARKYLYFLPVEVSDHEPTEGVYKFSRNLENTQNYGRQEGDKN